MNRSFLQLAHTFDPEKHTIGGWYVSTKLDGMRSFWDGGVTRGLPCKDIPFANIAKHSRLIIQPVSTGLWSRYGQPIHAPDWWLDQLPEIMLDGELYAGRGMFQFVTSTCKDHIAGDGWKQIKYHVFDSPPIRAVFCDGRINEGENFKKIFKDVQSWFELRCSMLQWHCELGSQFISVYPKYSEYLNGSVCEIHPQAQLPWKQDEAVKHVEMMLEHETALGGEGLIIRNSNAWYCPKRVDTMLKVKKWQDSKGVIIGYTTGRHTDKGSKLLGLMGNMIVSWQGKQFELSGFTDEERWLGCTGYNDFNAKEAEEWAIANPDTQLPDRFCAMKFPRGGIVTFRYRELTDSGIPKEARYWRKHA